MSSLSEVDAAVERAERAGADYTVLQCTSCYPTLPEKVGLNMLAVFRDRYDCPVGLSDHSGTIYPSLAAIALGAVIGPLLVAMFCPPISEYGRMHSTPRTSTIAPVPISCLIYVACSCPELSRFATLDSHSLSHDKYKRTHFSRVLGTATRIFPFVPYP